MTSNNKLDQALKFLILTDKVDLETLRRQVDSQEIINEMPKYKQELLFSKLVFEPVSLGSLFSSKLMLKKLSIDALASKLGVAPNLIADLLTDKVIPNKVPIVIMKKILNDFQLTFNDVEQAINKTFELFKNQTNHALSIAMHRKGSEGRFFQKEISSNVYTEEVKDKYIDELRQLMEESK